MIFQNNIGREFLLHHNPQCSGLCCIHKFRILAVLHLSLINLKKRHQRDEQTSHECNVSNTLVSNSNFVLESASRSDLCSGYLQKEAAVIPIILPFVYHGFHSLHCPSKNFFLFFAVHLRISSFFSMRIF